MSFIVTRLATEDVRNQTTLNALAIWYLIALAALLTSTGAFAQDIRPSFNCARATYPDERAICGSDRLAQMDQLAAIGLAQIPKDSKKLARESAFDLLKQRHACGVSALCIVNNQAQVVDTLKDYGAQIHNPPWLGSYRMTLVENGAPFVVGLPERIGQCTRTKISGITTRFGDELKRPTDDSANEGSAVNFANKGYQVSYGYEETLQESAIGDDAVLCLTSIPKDCPPGDDRGRVYMGINLRTKGSWLLPDASHMCGGA